MNNVDDRLQRVTITLSLGNRLIGSVAPGKTADLVVLGANPAENIANIEKVETVFKDGVGYDPLKLIKSDTGLVGLR